MINWKADAERRRRDDLDLKKIIGEVTRHLVRVGDVVKAHWFDDLTWYAGIVEKDEDDPRLFIYCPHRDTPEDGRTTDNYVTVGYLEDAHEVILLKPVDATFCLDAAPSGFMQSGHPKIYVCEEPKSHEGRHRAGFNLEDGRHATLEWDRTYEVQLMRPVDLTGVTPGA